MHLQADDPFAACVGRRFAQALQSDPPEQTVTAFEEAIASLTRAVYERSSRATHVASERQTVVQLRRYVVAIFHEIIET